jgi:hypothetical protein
MLIDILFAVVFAILMTWSVSLQIILQSVSEKRSRINVILVIFLTTLISGLIAVKI